MRVFLILTAAAIIGAGAAENIPRVVSGGAAITETIYALGAQGCLVAVDTFSTYPEEARKLPQVGYARQLAAEGILSMDSDIGSG